jgi:hypothetical protein
MRRAARDLRRVLTWWQHARRPHDPFPVAREGAYRGHVVGEWVDSGRADRGLKDLLWGTGPVAFLLRLLRSLFPRLRPAAERAFARVYEIRRGKAFSRT